MNQTSHQSKLLIISYQIDHAVKLCRAICNGNQTNFKLQLDSSFDNQDLVVLKNPLYLDTKYYTVNVTVILATYDYFLKNNDISANTENFKQSHGITALDGVYFLSKVVQPQKILGFQEYMRLCDQFIQLTNPNLQAIIYDREQNMPVDTNYIQDEEQHLENFIESIYENLDAVGHKAKQAQALSETDDSQGLQRVIEILECNMWTGMVSKEQTEKKAKKQKQQQQVQSTPEDEEKNMDNLYNILQKMKDMNNTTGLNDEERRNNAENIITQLMQACNFDEDESSDEDK